MTPRKRPAKPLDEVNVPQLQKKMSDRLEDHKRRYSHPGVSGRPGKPDKDQYVQITCVLRKDTVERLRQNAGRNFGQFLQEHLDRNPIPTPDKYNLILAQEQLWTTGTHKGHKIPVLYVPPPVTA